MNKTLHCSCAAHTELIACKLAPGLKGLHCTSCDGHMLMLEDYRVWRSTAPTQPAAAATATAEDNSARHCPACTRLMQRYRVGSTPDFRVDRCAACQAVWFAGGEWQALLATGMGTRLDEILTDAWQRQVQAEELRKGREAALRQRHGAAAMDELARIRQWLHAQPERDELLALLRADW
ncbi:MAG: zf-TFIIB domain-containing protein [Burkholderiales bacterium]|nr:zf-TFIIB domain-containing protein [Burkholderiales bacterium]